MQKDSNLTFTLLRIIIAVSLLAWLGYSSSVDWTMLQGLAQSLEYTALAAILFIISNSLIALRLQILINANQLNLRFLSAFKLTFIGLFFNTYLPGATGGDLIKIYYASKGNFGKRTEVATIIVLDRIIGLFGLLLLPLILAIFFPEMLPSGSVLQGLLAIALVAVIVIIAATAIGFRADVENIRILNWIYQKITVANLLKRIISTIHFYREHKKTLFTAIVLSLLLQLIMIGAMLAIAQAINPLGADSKMILLIPLGFLANSLPITPGGIGVGEVALDNLFALFHLQGGAEVLLGWRLILVVTGLLGFAFYLKGENRFVFGNQNNTDVKSNAKE